MHTFSHLWKLYIHLVEKHFSKKCKGTRKLSLEKMWEHKIYSKELDERREIEHTRGYCVGDWSGKNKSESYLMGGGYVDHILYPWENRSTEKEIKEDKNTGKPWNATHLLCHSIDCLLNDKSPWWAWIVWGWGCQQVLPIQLVSVYPHSTAYYSSLF